jgi:hypothetical protein
LSARDNIACQYCPSKFLSEKDFKRHMRYFSKDERKHISKYIDVHKHIGIERVIDLILEYLCKDY